MTKFKSQNEVDMEDFNDNKPSQSSINWVGEVFDLSESSKGDFWAGVILLIITLLALYGVWDVVSKIITRS